MSTAKLQTIFERIYTDIRPKLCTCRICSSLTVLPVFERECILKIPSGPCMLISPTIWVAIYMTIKLVRHCGAAVRQLAYLPEEVLHQLRHTVEKFARESDFVFDARVIEAVAVAYGDFSPDCPRLRKFLGPEGRVPVDYFASHRDIVALAIEYADERRAANLAAYTAPPDETQPSLETLLEDLLAEEQAEAARAAAKSAKKSAKKKSAKKKAVKKKDAKNGSSTQTEVVPASVPKPDGCVVCIAAHSAVALECGHVCVCEGCYASGIKKCPLCAKHVIRADSVCVWPDTQTDAVTCRTCKNVFPTNMCGQCKGVTCDGCLKQCACATKHATVRKLFWV